jgi:histidine triad (HIT) family protein
MLNAAAKGVAARLSVSSGPNNVFAKILRGDIPVEKLHEDEHCIAFRDVTPQAPQHVLVIPRRAIPRLADATPADAPVLGHMLLAASNIARTLGLADDGFRVVINNGPAAGRPPPRRRINKQKVKLFTTSTCTSSAAARCRGRQAKSHFVK